MQQALCNTRQPQCSVTRMHAQSLRRSMRASACVAASACAHAGATRTVSHSCDRSGCVCAAWHILVPLPERLVSVACTRCIATWAFGQTPGAKSNFGRSHSVTIPMERYKKARETMLELEDNFELMSQSTDLRARMHSHPQARMHARTHTHARHARHARAQQSVRACAPIRCKFTRPRGRECASANLPTLPGAQFAVSFGLRPSARVILGL